ncbi:ABC transporter permease subunit [Peptoniphilus equinus]|uniref:ABC transporter permease subunit n=1 Tax=Peptoniphilus equinus TaxID=3016343 RepID=A0ABY7QSY0_9FIRM|nr:ABC transporter permease subunit [Peptoniphilus equinus]WBW49894.1 ABC transporter permease subunit [Peptoniphilus equinus]
MARRQNGETWCIWTVLVLLFVGALCYPLMLILVQSFGGDEFTLLHYREIFTQRGFIDALWHSFFISALSALITTVLAFIMAYTLNYTNVNGNVKKFIKLFAMLPMLLPTITYGFAIIYSFGKQGLYTRLFGKQLFDIYGINGLLIGYIIYTLPIAFMLIHNTMGYIDRKFSIVSRMMGDTGMTTFLETVLRPLVGTLAVSFIQCFFLNFTDFGIPASVGGEVEVIAAALYNQMLGSVPNFNNGAVVAIMMLLPSIVSITVIAYLERYNIRYNKLSPVENKKNTLRDVVCGTISLGIIMVILAIFAVLFVVPLVQGWPYDMTFTWEHVQQVFEDAALTRVYRNALVVATLTAIFGTGMAYGASLVTSRSTISERAKHVIESVAAVTNTIPGMVLGIAFMLAFTGTPLQNTFAIIVLCNLVHLFATPYMMMKHTLSKMNLSWERTAKLMGDSWIKTVARIVTPNAVTSLIEVFGYYFVNALVTVSAVIFLAGARTMVITTKIKELQHFAKFNDIFVLSILLLVTNLIAKLLCQFLATATRGQKAA